MRGGVTRIRRRQKPVRKEKARPPVAHRWDSWLCSETQGFRPGLCCAAPAGLDCPRPESEGADCKDGHWGAEGHREILRPLRQTQNDRWVPGEIRAGANSELEADAE